MPDASKNCWVKDILKLQSMGILTVQNNLFGEKCFAVKVISLASITCDHEKELFLLTMYLKKVFENI